MESKRRFPTSLFGPRSLVAREVLRALWGVLTLPLRALDYWCLREAAREELRASLTATPHFAPDVARLELPARPLRVFIACAEASGEIHAVNFVAALRAAVREAGGSEPEFSGLGGPALAACGVDLLGDPVSRSAMGIAGVLGALPFYMGLIGAAARAFHAAPPDLFVPVDSPALHVPLAHIAKSCGVRVVHFVTPQYWGWAPWRVGGYKRAVDLALSILPFEPQWFERRGVAIAHVGHPLLDELPPRAADDACAPVDPCRRVVVLPGSRASVIRRNLPSMLSALEAARSSDEELEVLIAQRDDTHRALIESILEQLSATARVQLRIGDLESVIESAQLALSVSGTILLHLLHQRLPAIVVYRAEHERQLWMARQFLTTPWFASVNLLAGVEVYPEFFFRDPVPAPNLIEALQRGLHDAGWRARCVAGLELANGRLGPPGATRRAALAALSPWNHAADGAPR